MEGDTEPDRSEPGRADASTDADAGTDTDTDTDTDQRSWGSFVTLDERRDYRVKRMSVDAGQRLNYRVHAQRAEHWIVVVGRAVVTLDGIPFTLGPGDTITIPAGGAHQVENAGEGEMVFIEVQTGAQFAEDDIVRLENP